MATHPAEPKLALLDATISDLQNAMAQGRLSSVELTVRYLNRIDRYDRSGPELGTIAVLNPNALEEAAQADARRAKGEHGDLLGIPLIVKDSFNVANLPTSNGVSKFLPLVAKEDAFVVSQLRQRGAVILGKGNMQAMAEGGSSDSYPPRGKTFPYELRHAYGKRLNPSGSSFGNSGAMASCFAAGSLAGETGKSIRAPANNSSLVGLKTTKGLISLRGTFPNHATKDTLGTITRTVMDAAVLLDAIVADDPRDDERAFFPLPSAVRPASYRPIPRKNPFAGKRIGLPRPYVAREGSLALAPEVQLLFQAAIKVLESAGATVLETDWPFYNSFRGESDECRDYWKKFQLPEGFRNGHEQAKMTANSLSEFVRSFQVPDIDYRTVGQLIPGGQKYHDHLQKLAIQGEGKSKVDGGFGQIVTGLRAWGACDIEAVMAANRLDLLVYPTNAEPTPSFGDKKQARRTQMTAEVSDLGYPAITVPMGYTEFGRPVGLSFFTGKYYDEAALLAYALAYEEQTHTRRAPELVPPLPGEKLVHAVDVVKPRAAHAPQLQVQIEGVDGTTIWSDAVGITMLVAVRSADTSITTEVFLNGRQVLTFEGVGKFSLNLPVRQLREGAATPLDDIALNILTRNSFGHASARRFEFYIGSLSCH